MVLSDADYRFSERLDETRIWKPSYGPRAKERKFVGKEVHVTWQPPEFTRAGALMVNDKVVPVYTPSWFGYVAELGRIVPESELVPITTTEAK